MNENIDLTKEKAKAYDKAVERTKKSYDNGITEEIFPELKEDNDEKMRNFIINELTYLRATNEKDSDRYEELTNAIAWLEKQRDKNKLIQELGEYKVKYTQEVLEQYVNSMSNKDDERLRKTTIAFLKDFVEQGYENAVECIAWLENQDKKHTNKNNTKFNIGDWVVFITSESVYQVEKKENYEYTLRYILGGSLCLSFSNEKLIRKWTIQDIKDSDVLVNGSNIFIFHFINNRRLMGYCHVNMNNGNLYNDIGRNECFCTIDASITPATKEQRDLLFQKIKEAGYKWNAETKILEKLIKPKFKIGDKIRHKETNNMYEIIKVYDNSYGIAGFNWGISIKYQDQYELVNNKFDPKTLQPFDKVLVRDNNNCTWMATIFSHINNAIIYPYICTNSAYKYCIPYNDDTKYLVGTTLEVSEFYRYWED